MRTAQDAAMAAIGGPNVTSLGESVSTPYTPIESRTGRSSKVGDNISVRQRCIPRVHRIPRHGVAARQHLARGWHKGRYAAISDAIRPYAIMEAARTPDDVPAYRFTQSVRSRSSREESKPEWKEKQRNPDDRITLKRLGCE